MFGFGRDVLPGTWNWTHYKYQLSKKNPGWRHVPIGFFVLSTASRLYRLPWICGIMQGSDKSLSYEAVKESVGKW